MEEIWIETGNKNNDKTIVAISNRGRIKRKNGTIEYTKYRQMINYNGRVTLIHRIIAENFIPKTKEDLELGRNYVDHITHNPTDMNINDIRNMRWCTHKENDNFPEAIKNRSLSHIGKGNPRTNRKDGIGDYIEKTYGIISSSNRKLYKRIHQYHRRRNEWPTQEWVNKHS